LLVVFLDFGELLLHLDNIGVTGGGCRRVSINLELVQSAGEHFVLFLKAIDTLVRLSNVLEELGVVGFALEEF